MWQVPAGAMNLSSARVALESLGKGSLITAYPDQ